MEFSLKKRFFGGGEPKLSHDDIAGSRLYFRKGKFHWTSLVHNRLLGMFNHHENPVTFGEPFS